MTLNGPTLIALSAVCITAASLMGQVNKRQTMSAGLTETIAARDCMDDGLVTPAGRIGCITPVIFPFTE
ncbi:MAG: hypothetical protein QNJ16_04510 [Rhodobacter sp.]|nr:hypothetical protein [Rhodobacter sp.]